MKQLTIILAFLMMIGSQASSAEIKTPIDPLAVGKRKHVGSDR